MTVEPQLTKDALSTLPLEEHLEDPEVNSESTPLLSAKPPLQTYDSVWDVMRDYCFWVLALVVLLTLGSVSDKNYLTCRMSVYMSGVVV